MDLACLLWCVNCFINKVKVLLLGVNGIGTNCSSGVNCKGWEISWWFGLELILWGGDEKGGGEELGEGVKEEIVLERC